MKKQTGIWLDKEKAIIITLDDGKHTITTIISDIVTKERFDGEKKIFGRFGSQFLNKEKKNERRLKSQTLSYLKNIMSKILDVDEIVLFGPANLKNELEKLIMKDNVMSSKLKAVEPADIMTENQMVAWVKKFFLE
jgi:stalled ribosome rescue protein Dom34